MAGADLVDFTRGISRRCGWSRARPNSDASAARQAAAAGLPRPCRSRRPDRVTERELVAAARRRCTSTGRHRRDPRRRSSTAWPGRDRHALVDSPARTVAWPRRLVFLDGGVGADGYMSDIIRLIGVGDLSARPTNTPSWPGGRTRHDRRGRPGASGSRRSTRPAAGVRGGRGGRGLAARCPATASGWSSGSGRSSAATRDLTRRRPAARDDAVPGTDVVPDRRRPGPMGDLRASRDQVLVTDTGVEVLSGDLEARLWKV